MINVCKQISVFVVEFPVFCFATDPFVCRRVGAESTVVDVRSAGLAGVRPPVLSESNRGPSGQAWQVSMAPSGHRDRHKAAAVPHIHTFYTVGIRGGFV